MRTERGRRQSGVELLYLCREVLLAHSTFELQRRCYLSRFKGEVPGQDREPLDLLVPRKLAVDLVDGTLNGGCRVRGIDLLRERDQRRDIGAPVSDDERLRDHRVRLERVLQVLRRDVLSAGGDEDVLQAVGDRQEAVFVEMPDVTRAKPSVRRKDLAGRLLVLE